MEQRLQEEGLGSSASSDKHLSLLWQLYTKSESTVRSLNQQIQDLQKERVAEIEKTPSSPLMTFEFMLTEAQRSEISEMLLQEGLADIIPISLSEQVAYLLADRASLLEKIQSQENVYMKTTEGPDVQKKDCRGNVVRTEAPDRTVTLSKDKKPQEEDIH
ncbi:hypothetical protein cypCar_00020699 [Cyprinus carpio]|nr:hypothetical protein cypCar_00020699 [Cyprinus carpio]